MSSPNKNYGNLIWTNHAISRLNQRGFSQEMAWNAFSFADSTEKEGNSTKFKKKFENSTVTVVAKQNEKREWIILSCWIYPPLKGTADHRKKKEYINYQKSSGFKKILLEIKQQLGF